MLATPPLEAFHRLLVLLGEMIMFWLDFLREVIDAILGDADPLQDS